jgi:hypothetical protein
MRPRPVVLEHGADGYELTDETDDVRLPRA